MKRLALISDIHGNVQALDAVLADIATHPADDVYCLGDLVGYGPDPAGAISRIRERNIPTIRGNYDDGVGKRLGSCGCYYTTAEAKSDGEASYRFTDAALDNEQHDWLAALPDTLRLEVGGVRILLAHGSPRKINEYLLPDRTDRFLTRLARESEADVVCVGHVHIPYHRMIQDDEAGTIHYVSTGSVGKPKDSDPRACWIGLVLGTENEVREAALEDNAIATGGHSSTFIGSLIHRVDYDVERTATDVARAGLPDTLADALRSA